MKEGRGLPALAAELERQKAAKRDFLAPVKRLTVRSNGTSHLEVGKPVDEPFVMNDIAHQQLADYTGVPKPFYDRLRKDTENLKIAVWDEQLDSTDPNTPVFDVLVNSLMWQKGEDQRLVRTLDGTARALLSDKYNPDLDNYDVFRMAAKVIEEQGLGPDDVVSCEVTERKLYLKVVSPRIQAVVHPSNIANRHGHLKEPQVIQAGFLLTNSETGLGSLSVQQLVYKLMCTVRCAN
jgi:hypothetical protein